MGERLQLSEAIVGRFKQFSDHSGIVYHPYFGTLLALPEDAALLIDCLCRGALSETELLSHFCSTYHNLSPSAVKARFDDLLSSLIDEHCLVSVSPG